MANHKEQKSTRPKSRLKFGIRLLLGVMTALAVVLSYFARAEREFKHETDLVDQLYSFVNSDLKSFSRNPKYNKNFLSLMTTTVARDYRGLGGLLEMPRFQRVCRVSIMLKECEPQIWDVLSQFTKLDAVVVRTNKLDCVELELFRRMNPEVEVVVVKP